MAKHELSRTKKSIRNSMAGVLAHAVLLLLNFISRTVFIRCLSVEYLGINGLFANVITVLSFAELGISGAVVYAMYKPAKEQDTEKLRQLVGMYRTAYLWIAGIIAAVGGLLSFKIGFFMKEPPDVPEKIQIIFLLFLLQNVCSYLMAYKQSVLDVEQNSYIVSLMQMLSKTVEIGVQIAVLLLTHSFYLYLAVQIGGTLLNNLLLTLYVNRHYPWVKERAQSKLPKKERRKIFKDVRELALSKIAGVVSNGADNIIIAKILGLVSVGVVSNYTLIINAVHGFLWAALSNVTGSFGNLNVDADVHKKRQVFDECYLGTTWIYSFVCVSLMVLLNPFITLWLGRNFLAEKPVIWALVLIIFISGINFPVYTFRVTCGYFKEARNAYILFGVCNVLLSILLGLRWGLFGVYIATSVSRFCTSEIAEGRVLYQKILQLPFYRYFVRYGCTLAMLLLNYWITNAAVTAIPADGVGGFVLQVLVCVLVSNGVLLLRYGFTESFRRLLQRVKGLFVHSV